MSDDFDIGPLTWVKGDIFQSLDSVLESVEALKANPQNVASMRFSQTHLYQASGALDMVGLEGCKLFCHHLEKLAVKLEKNELEATPEVLENFATATKALKHYIQALLNGAADIPLRLYPALQPIVAAMGEAIHEGELFFPDTSNSVPKDVPSKEFSEEEYLAFIGKQRSLYQKSLLGWMQAKDNGALANMHEALANVTAAQHKTSVKTMWWVSSAFSEALESPAIADNVATKKLCRRLDQALRQLTTGESKPNPNLLRDLLYFVAISDIDKPTTLKVKEVFSLDGTVDSKTSTHVGSNIISEVELAAVNDLLSMLNSLREIWDEVSNRIDFENVDAKADDALIDLDNVLITKFTDKLGAGLESASRLSQPVVKGLFEALSLTSTILRDDKSKVTQVALIEVATALHQLDSGLTRYQHLDGDSIQYMAVEIERLNAIASGLSYDKRHDASLGGLDSNTLDAVVSNINDSLTVVEQSLDTYFRNPADKTTLSLAPTQLKQMAAAFDMLSLPTPMHIIQACDHYIQYFQQDDYDENQTDFELLAESLSMVGLYVNEMPNVRLESTAALEGALARLNAVLKKTGIEFEEVKIETISPDETAKQNEKQKEVSQTTVVGDAATIIDRAFDDELSDIYLTEAEEVLAQIAQNLQALRVNATDDEPMAEVRRSYHTLKGSGRTVGLVGQAEVAAEVEIFLNDVLDKKQTLNPVQISKLEEITSAFAAWAAGLRADNEVSVNQAYWLSEIEALSKLSGQEAEAPASKKEKEDAYVLISGKRKLSKPLYEIFLSESMQNLSILEQDVAKLIDKKSNAPAKRAHHAVHTMASNALATGFTPMGELCRALENWLDAAMGNWLPEHLTLYSNVTKAVAKMWQAVSKLKTPRAARSLIKLLDEAAEKVSENKGEIDNLLDEEQAAEESLGAIVETEKVIEPVGNRPEQIVATKKVEKEVNPELLEMFIEEANEILPQIGGELRAWQSKPTEIEHSDALQRFLHTLKGSARMAAQVEIGNTAHALEEHIASVGKKTPTEDDFETMFVALDRIASFFDAKASDVPAGAAVQGTIEDDEQLAIGRAENRKSQSLRLRADMLDRLINEAGEVSIIRSRIDREMVGFKQYSNDLTDSLVRLRSYLRELEIEAETQMQSRMNILQEANESFDPLEFDRFTRLQELTRMIAESVNDVGTIQTGLLTNLDQAEAALQQQNRMNRDLQQGLLGVRMLPFQQITERMQRIVRQTARELKKTVDLVIEGEATEVDRSIIDKIAAPLEHLLRNAIAHGIEPKRKRKAEGKPEKATIKISVSTENDEIHIIVNDDGAGVDLEKVKQKAIDSNLLDASADITEDLLLSVIFEPGFSTLDDVSQIAGRGVGLDVVRNDISSLGGRIDMSSEAGKGAVFNIYLPITQSVAQVLTVRAGEDVYAVPVAMIEQAQKIKRDDLLAAYAEGKIKWNDVSYPFHHLAKLLDHQEHQLEELPYASVLLLRSGVHTVALHVDDVIGNREVVMKEMGPQLARVPGIVGATVTGEGSIVLIINPVLIANREVLSVGSVTVKNIKAKKVVKKLRALVVDDSLTMRKVLGRLLEREGYEVLVAKDGMDAMESLQVRTPDIILTDIEMPRMDGFGLSRNIRDDVRTAKTPLIMISSRTADKHQNLAKEIGVDAFFGKPVQDEDLIKKMKELLKLKK